MKRILVVEDGEKHREDADKFFRGLEGEVKVTYSTCFSEGLEQLSSHADFAAGKSFGEYVHYDGVILDIFMPYAQNHFAESEYLKELQDAEAGKADHFGIKCDPKEAKKRYERQKAWNQELIPGGLGLAMFAEKVRLPFVICTAGNHHGAKYEWICNLTRELGWPEMVDGCSDWVGEADTKRWRDAYKQLEEKITVADKK